MTVAIEDTGTVDLDIPTTVSTNRSSIACVRLLSAPYPKSYALLEVVVKVVGLPILDVVRELSLSAILYYRKTCTVNVPSLLHQA